MALFFIKERNENLKKLQRNWIGKSEGLHVEFKILDDKDTVINNAEIYTTCIETIYGITFLVMAVPTYNQNNL